MYNLNYLLITIGLAVLPSLVWFFFYLKEDAHPEPRYWLFIIFLTGAALAPLVIFLEMTISRFFSFASILYNLEGFFLIIIIAPLVEEIAKYGVTHLALNKNPVLDEPVDGMIYVITAALGFAAIENIVNLIPNGQMTLETASYQMIARFLSATFLHTLSSAVLGYFLAISMLDFKKRKVIFITGFALAAAMHSFYNYLILLFDKADFMPKAIAVFLLFMATIVFWQFKRLKKLMAVCRLPY